MEVTRDTFINIGRAFASMGLAIACNNGGMVEGMHTEPLNEDAANKLKARVMRGDVTCIVANPEPFKFIIYKGWFGQIRYPWGLWLERPASWRGKLVNPIMTVDEARAKGIPVPDSFPMETEE